MKQAFLRAHGPTWLVAIAIYGAWCVLTMHHAVVPFPVLVVLGGLVMAWHGSLQHETIHGHPGPRWAARLLGAPPLSLWLPYEVYRDTHRRHHATAHLTDPAHDPEAPTASLVMQTALGRFSVGPLLVIFRFLAHELGALAQDQRGRRSVWVRHVATVAVVLAYLHVVAEMPLWKYLGAFVLPGASLTLLRSFAEHRPHAARERRTTVVEAGPLLRLLFLNNNFHIVHHEAPHLPWFELPAAWAARREDVLARRPELVLGGYLPLVLRHLVRPQAECTEARQP